MVFHFVTQAVAFIPIPDKFNMKLIMESIVKWIKKVEVLCCLCEVKKIEYILHMHLAGGAFSVYQQLRKERKSEFPSIKETLYTVFTTDTFVVYKQIRVCCLHPGESVDVYLADKMH